MTEKYGLIGFSLEHSFSAKWFSDKFKQERINAIYRNFELSDLNLFPELLKKQAGLKGLNVTIPYKKEIIAYLDELDESAKEVGAVNVIKIITKNAKPYLIGYNSDVYGFEQSLKPLLKPCHHSALVLGTGGAAQAVIVALKHLGIQIIQVSRHSNKNYLCYEAIKEDILEHCKLIINTTPLGMFPNVDEAPKLSYNKLSSFHLLYDLVYNPEKTLFLQYGEMFHAQIKNGLEMLELQAKKSWEIWKSK